MGSINHRDQHGETTETRVVPNSASCSWTLVPFAAVAAVASVARASFCGLLSKVVAPGVRRTTKNSQKRWLSTKHTKRITQRPRRAQRSRRKAHQFMFLNRGCPHPTHHVSPFSVMSFNLLFNRGISSSTVPQTASISTPK